MTTPARGYRWEIFTEGNLKGLRHGAFSERMVSPLAAAIVDQVHADAPWLLTPAFRLTVLALAHAEAQCELLRRFIDEHGPLDADGKPRPALGALDTAERRAERGRQQLALTPAAWASLYRTIADGKDDETGGLDAIKAIGAQIIDASTQAAQEGDQDAQPH